MSAPGWPPGWPETRETKFLKLPARTGELEKQLELGMWGDSGRRVWTGARMHLLTRPRRVTSALKSSRNPAGRDDVSHLIQEGMEARRGEVTHPHRVTQLDMMAKRGLDLRSLAHSADVHKGPMDTSPHSELPVLPCPRQRNLPCRRECSRSELPNRGAPGHVWLLSPGDVVGVAEEMNF